MVVITVLDKLIGVQLSVNLWTYGNRISGKVVGNISCNCNFFIVRRSQVESKEGSLSVRSMMSGRTMMQDCRS